MAQMVCVKNEGASDTSPFVARPAGGRAASARSANSGSPTAFGMLRTSPEAPLVFGPGLVILVEVLGYFEPIMDRLAQGVGEGDGPAAVLGPLELRDPKPLASPGLMSMVRGRKLSLAEAGSPGRIRSCRKPFEGVFDKIIAEVCKAEIGRKLL